MKKEVKIGIIILLLIIALAGVIFFFMKKPEEKPVNKDLSEIVLSKINSKRVSFPTVKENITVLSFEFLNISKEDLKSAISLDWDLQKSYVVISHSDNEGLVYYIAGVDNKNEGIPLTKVKELSNDKIINNPSIINLSDDNFSGNDEGLKNTFDKSFIKELPEVTTARVYTNKKADSSEPTPTPTSDVITPTPEATTKPIATKKPTPTKKPVVPTPTPTPTTPPVGPEKLNITAIINKAKTMINDDEIKSPTSEELTIVSLPYLKLSESDLVSPNGNSWNLDKTYVLINNNNDSLEYYFAGIDTTNNGVDLAKADTLLKTDMKSNPNNLFVIGDINFEGDIEGKTNTVVNNTFTSVKDVENIIVYEDLPVDTPAHCFEFNKDYQSITNYFCGNRLNPTNTFITDLVIPRSIDGVKVKHTALNQDGYYANSFSGNSLKSVYFPVGLETIQAFQSNEIKEVIVPKTVKKIGSAAFASNLLEKVVFEGDIDLIESSAFISNNSINWETRERDPEYVGNKITELTFKGKVKTIGTSSFMNNLIEKLDFSHGVELIKESAFLENEINEIISPESGPNIVLESSVFYRNKLTELDFNKMKIDIVEGAGSIFAENQIKTVVIHTQEQIDKVYSNSRGNPVEKMVFKGTIGDMEEPVEFVDFGSSVKEIIFEEGITRIPERSFLWLDLANIEVLRIPDSVVEIANSAFSNTTIKKVILGENLKTIGLAAFANSTVEEVVFNNKLEKIETAAFYGSNIKSVTLPSSLKEIGASSFSANKITNLVIPNSVETIGSVAFSRNEIETITISNKLTVIEEGVFSNNKLTSVIIPNSITEIKNGAFRDNLLETVVLNEGLTTIDDEAFSRTNPGEESLLVVNIPSTVTTIGDDVFINTLVNEINSRINIFGSCNRFDALFATPTFNNFTLDKKVCL